MTSKRFLAGAVLTLLLSYPLLFYVYKYNVPWTGMNDFRHYARMVEAPLDFSVGPAVFVMRQFTPLLARGLLELGLAFPNDVWFEHHIVYEGVRYSKDVFFALIVANLLGLCVAGGLIYAAIAGRDAGRRGILSLPGVAAVALLLLAGNTIFYVVAPLTGGWSWALAAAMFLAIERRDGWAWVAVPLLFVAVFQRELITVAAAAWAGATLLFDRLWSLPVDPCRRRRLVGLLLAALAAMGTYAVLRGGLLPVVERHGDQLDPMRWLAVIPRLPRILTTHEWFLMGVMKLNIFTVWAGCAVAALAGRRTPPAERVQISALLVTAATLFMISLGTLNTAPDRVVMTIAPLYVISLMGLIQRYLQAEHPRAGQDRP